MKVNQEEKEMVTVRTKQMKRWANTLYFLGKEGTDYARNDYDIERYEEMLKISESLYINWKKNQDNKFCEISLKQLNYFIFRLNDITEKGLEHSPSDYDADRYIESQLILIDMEHVREAYQEKKKETPKKEEKPKEKQVTFFFSDEELASAINSLINETKEKLAICSPWIDDIIERENELGNLKKQKVEITLLTRSAKKETKHFQSLQGLKRQRFPIEINDNLHSKLIISDEKKMYIGSANLLRRSLTVNHEAGILTEDPRIIKPAIDYFNRLFDEAGDRHIRR